jgi:hypothetical protein
MAAGGLESFGGRGYLEIPAGGGRLLIGQRQRAGTEDVDPCGPEAGESSSDRCDLCSRGLHKREDVFGLPGWGGNGLREAVVTEAVAEVHKKRGVSEARCHLLESADEAAVLVDYHVRGGGGIRPPRPVLDNLLDLVREFGFAHNGHIVDPGREEFVERVKDKRPVAHR